MSQIFLHTKSHRASTSLVNARSSATNPFCAAEGSWTNFLVCNCRCNWGQAKAGRSICGSAAPGISKRNPGRRYKAYQRDTGLRLTHVNRTACRFIEGNSREGLQLLRKFVIVALSGVPGDEKHSHQSILQPSPETPNDLIRGRRHYGDPGCVLNQFLHQHCVCCVRTDASRAPHQTGYTPARGGRRAISILEGTKKYFLVIAVNQTDVPNTDLPFAQVDGRRLVDRLTTLGYTA
jgi:hypothetical protein